jgi:hypothetical protein
MPISVVVAGLERGVVSSRLIRAAVENEATEVYITREEGLISNRQGGNGAVGAERGGAGLGQFPEVRCCGHRREESTVDNQPQSEGQVPRE